MRLSTGAQSRRMMPSMPRILAIDYGRARIGLAVSDPLGITVRPLPPVDGRGGDRVFHQLKEICGEEEVETLVLGLPLQLDGSEGPAVLETRRFRAKLEQHLGLPVEEHDERLTSRQAHAEMKSAGVRHRQRKKHVDSSAALLLLQSWLATRRGAR